MKSVEFDSDDGEVEITHRAKKVKAMIFRLSTALKFECLAQNLLLLV